MASDEILARQSWATAAHADSGEVASIQTPLLRRGDPIAFVGGKLAAALIAPLTAAEFTIVAVEQRHPMLAGLPAEAPEYEAFGNGYGEVHSARAFRQLVERAGRTFVPKEDRWDEGARVVDPFRPALRYAAASDREFDVLQERHLNVVRTAFRRAKTLVVALSSSEVWEATADGAVFPGIAGAGNPRFDAERHAARTLTIEETVVDLSAAVTALRGINPGIAIVLMVSPEPPTATALPVHVLAAATVGKAVLRIAAETVTQIEGVHYFPALELASRQIGLGGYPADGTIPDRVVSAVAGTLVAISEGGAVTFEGAAPPIVATAATPAPPPTADKPAARPAAATKAEAGAKSKPATVVAKPSDPYSEMREAEKKIKLERAAAKRRSKGAAASELTGNGESGGGNKREAKQAKRAANHEEKRAALAEAKQAREAKRAANHDEKRAALAEVKQARETRRASRLGADASDAGATPKRRIRKPSAEALETTAKAAEIVPARSESKPVAAPKRGRRRGATAQPDPAETAAVVAPTDAAPKETTPQHSNRRQAKMAARRIARDAPGSSAEPAKPVSKPTPSRGKRRRGSGASDTPVATESAPAIAEPSPSRVGRRGAKSAAPSTDPAEIVIEAPEGQASKGAQGARPGRARRAETADKAALPAATDGSAPAPTARRRRAKAKSA